MKIWIHGRNDRDVRFMLAHVNASDDIVGFSIRQSAIEAFPYGSLIQPLQAAIRGEIEWVLVSDVALLGDSPEQIDEIKEIFQSYQVFIISVCSAGSSNSW